MDTVTQIVGLSGMIIGFFMLLIAAAGMLDWYGAIDVPWLNKDRKSSREDTSSRGN